MGRSWMVEDCGWTLLDPGALEERAEGGGGEEGTGGLREGEALQGEDEGAHQGEEEEVSQQVCILVGGQVWAVYVSECVCVCGCASLCHVRGH